MVHVIVEMLRSFALRCPHCHRGKVMRNWFALNQKCPACSYVFMAEQGDFWGGMVFAYTYSGALAFGLAAVLILNNLLSLEMRVYVTALFAASMVLVLHPFTRCNWITVLYLTRSREAEYRPSGTDKS
jgi:uncharacterized protein (DUF983 family)